MLQFFAKRPQLFFWAIMIAMLVGRAHHHGRGFHQW